MSKAIKAFFLERESSGVLQLSGILVRAWNLIGVETKAPRQNYIANLKHDVYRFCACGAMTNWKL